MKRKAQPMLSATSQYTLDQYSQVLQQIEDLSPVPICNYLSNLRWFSSWCKGSLQEKPEVVPLHWFTQIMGYDSRDTTMLYIPGTKQNRQQNVEKIA
jgi:hypothetical protein